MTPARVAALNAQRLAGVRPELRAIVERLLAAAAGRGWVLLVTEGIRSRERQAELWAVGRRQQPDGTWRVVGKTQTQSAPGTSKHETGRAVDLVFVVDGELSWKGVPWPELGALGESLGLRWGGRWTRSFGPQGDSPHFELPRGTLPP